MLRWAMTTRKKPGPKPRPIALTRRHGVLVKLTDAEYALIRQMARAAKMPVSALFRQSVLATAA